MFAATLYRLYLSFFRFIVVPLHNFYMSQYANTPVFIKEYDVCSLQSKVIFSNLRYFGSWFCPRINLHPYKITSIEYGNGISHIIKNSFETVLKDDHYVYVGVLDFDISYQINKYNSSLTVANGITTKDLLTVLYLDEVIGIQEYYRLLMDTTVKFRIMSSDIQDIEIGMDNVLIF
jgi:hypothetical protein